MRKISTKTILFVTGFIIIFLLQDFIVNPIIKEKYLNDDLRNFRSVSWKYTFSIFAILAGIIIFIARKNIKLSNIPSIILSLIVFGTGFYFGLHTIIDNSLLLINLKTKNGEIIKIYEVINHRKKEVFWLDNKEPVHDNDDLEKINKNRIKQHLKSIFEYQNGDTVKVKFNRGILNINYID